MKYIKALSLGLVTFSLLGCNQPPQVSQGINPTAASNTPQEENSTSQTVVANVETPTTSNTQNYSSPRVTQKREKTTQIKNNSPQVIAQTQKPKSQYSTAEELDEKLRKRNGRIIGSASCDGDGIENDVRVDFNGDGMPDECVSANLRMHPLILQDNIDFVRDTVNNLEKGSQVTSKEQGNYIYYLWKKNDEVVKVIKSKKESASSIQYWFYLGKPFAVQRIDDSNSSSVKNTIFIYYKNGQLYSIYEIFGGEGDNSKHITEFNKQQLQEAANLFNSYQEIFQVFDVK